MPRTSKNVEDFKKFLDEAVSLVAGESSGTIESQAKEVHVAIVLNVTGHGRHPGAIYADQNRFHASADGALEEAHQLLEEWEQEHYPMSEEDEEHRTETFDGRTWTLPTSAFVDAVYGTDVEKFIDVEDESEDEDEPAEEDDEEEEKEDEDSEEDDNDVFSREEMDEGYVISDKRGGGYSVSHLGSFSDMDDALEAIEKDMKRSNVYPNIYYVNDHGNVDLLDKDGNSIKSRV